MLNKLKRFAQFLESMLGSDTYQLQKAWEQELKQMEIERGLEDE